MNKDQVFALANELLRSSQLELDDCRTHVGEFSRDSWLACMVTSRILARCASALITLTREMEKDDAAREKARSQFQHQTPISIRGGLSTRDETPLRDGERSDPPAARDQLHAPRDEGAEQN